jgi:hypothetical protein
MTTTSTGLATALYQELTALRAELIAPAHPRDDEAPQSWGQRC